MDPLRKCINVTYILFVPENLYLKACLGFVEDLVEHKQIENSYTMYFFPKKQSFFMQAIKNKSQKTLINWRSTENQIRLTFSIFGYFIWFYFSAG